MVRTLLATVAAAALGATVLLGAGNAGATPLSPTAAVPAAPAAPIAELAHGCHHGVLRDRRGSGTDGWHYHTRSCARVDVPPPGFMDAPDYRGYHHPLPRCSYRCQFVGPLKTCQSVCH